ncbi:EMIL1-like protein [Mya arenaria]|uniref:EMIL1-like protein n=1 Tax=Mya arenaria TaxID=6604 RepID=A0ABY7E1K1_MYAAR|nr:EMIL1-like protein [Mya arenaria]
MKSNEKHLEERVMKLEYANKENEAGKSRRQEYRGSVSFTAYLSHSVTNIVHNTPVVYDTVLLNDGAAYDPLTGVFTAPLTGVYLFSVSSGSKNLPGSNLTQYDVFTRLVVDGVHKLSAVAESKNVYDDEQGSTTAILPIQKGSRVWVFHQITGGHSLFAEDGERVTSFAGALLYETESIAHLIG